MRGGEAWEEEKGVTEGSGKVRRGIGRTEACS